MFKHVLYCLFADSPSSPFLQVFLLDYKLESKLERSAWHCAWMPSCMPILSLCVWFLNLNSIITECENTCTKTKASHMITINCEDNTVVSVSWQVLCIKVLALGLHKSTLIMYIYSLHYQKSDLTKPILKCWVYLTVDVQLPSLPQPTSTTIRNTPLLYRTGEWRLSELGA